MPLLLLAASLAVVIGPMAPLASGMIAYGGGGGSGGTGGSGGSGGSGGGSGGSNPVLVSGQVAIETPSLDTQNNYMSWSASFPTGVVVLVKWWYGGAMTTGFACTTTGSNGNFAVDIPPGEARYPSWLDQYHAIDGNYYYLSIDVDPWEDGACYGLLPDTAPYFDQTFWTNTFTGLLITDTAQVPIPSVAGVAFFNDPGAWTGTQWLSEGAASVSYSSTVSTTQSLTLSASVGIAQGSATWSNTESQSSGQTTETPTENNCLGVVKQSPYSQGSCYAGLELVDEMTSQFYTFTEGSAYCCEYILQNVIHGNPSSNDGYYRVTSAPLQIDPESLSWAQNGGANLVCSLTAQDTDQTVSCDASHSTASDISESLGLSLSFRVPYAGVEVSLGISGSLDYQIQTDHSWSVSVNNPTGSGCIDFSVYQDPNQGALHVWPTGTSCSL
ncbi:MAG: hypothetical protein KGJ23_03750 [Euryarchaeota archaeon]|nr:hypothetical protein [Euryarchaeota archaeon]MDE1835715.1 hypothetical protein [Euryarchaeota archaeon]MDE1880861.1 hypothetical protein [Euryarchaeota archaeon]MDE2043905.1 hypothetical protein [Thermoplasmata archaeon]